MPNESRYSLLILVMTVCIVILTSCVDVLPYYARGEMERSYPHDEEAFTQGLFFDESTLYECTGLYGESSLRRVDLETGEVLQLRRLPPDYFGEGCTGWRDVIIQVTWKAGLGFVYDEETFDVRRQFSYSGEGWGLTHDGQRLIMSDGTSYLRFFDPDTLEETGRVKVSDNGEPVDRLNELEWVNGQVWANVWQTSQIARIDPQTGDVLGWIDFSDFAEGEPRGVLNGIAARGEDIFVTGKRWEAVYQVDIVPADSN